ncbi:hypothetical protein EJ110_NYTH32969 [Nymphaea thermarum]|nr:hypothetical protein EJ110_NYTH32969 [Nymphaea thermarum]
MLVMRRGPTNSLKLFYDNGSDTTTRNNMGRDTKLDSTHDPSREASIFPTQGSETASGELKYTSSTSGCIWGRSTPEVEVAVAYDIATLKYRGVEAIATFRICEDQHQIVFLVAHSKEEIIDTLKKNTYHKELAVAKSNATACSCPPSAWAGREFCLGFT